MTLAEVIDTLQTWIRNADDECDREEMGRVAGLKEALHEIKRIEPCENAISKQAVLNILDDMVKDYIKENDFDKALGVAWVKVQKLPPVTPQPKTGHWIKTKEQDDAEPLILWKCSECLTVQRLKTKYCPNCGAKM